METANCKQTSEITCRNKFWTRGCDVLRSGGAASAEQGQHQHPHANRSSARNNRRHWSLPKTRRWNNVRYERLHVDKSTKVCAHRGTSGCDPLNCTGEPANLLGLCPISAGRRIRSAAPALGDKQNGLPKQNQNPEAFCCLFCFGREGLDLERLRFSKKAQLLFQHFLGAGRTPWCLFSGVPSQAPL